MISDIFFFRLERVTDPKYGKIYPAYKMFVPADLLKQEKKASTAKVLKKLPINSRISDNDLTFKLKTIRKWLEKNCEVHIAILKSSQADTAMVNFCFSWSFNRFLTAFIFIILIYYIDVNCKRDLLIRF